MLTMGNEIVRYLPDKKYKNLTASQTVSIVRICSQQCTHSAPDFIQIDSLLVEL